jgi:RND family efflux transporter MFP subunit
MEPSELVHIGSPVEGLIERIHAERADYVHAGDVLVELDAGVEAAAVEVARARAEMKGEVLSNEAAVDLGRRRTERVEALFQREAVSLDIHDEVETEARLARHALEHAREKRQLASLELEQARAMLERRTIHSPIDGFVVERHLAVGEVVDEQVILSVARVDPLRVEVIAPSSLYGSIREGMTAEIVPEIPGDRSLRAPVSLVDPVIDAASGTFGVRVELRNPDHAVPAGLRCRIRFLAAPADSR